jgi:Asp-tRNA(Asn)/Glu-tRNA(Gln) amidotransferase C subunit
MTGPVEKESLVERLLNEAASNLCREEAESMRTVIEGIAEAIIQVDSFNLDPRNEPFMAEEG